MQTSTWTRVCLISSLLFSQKQSVIYCWLDMIGSRNCYAITPSFLTPEVPLLSVTLLRQLDWHRANLRLAGFNCTSEMLFPYFSFDWPWAENRWCMCFVNRLEKDMPAHYVNYNPKKEKKEIKKIIHSRMSILIFSVPKSWYYMTSV